MEPFDGRLYRHHQHTALTPRRPQDFGNLTSEWASSALDRQPALDDITPIFDFKPFSRRGWALKNLVGNWNLAFTYTYQSPEYGTVQSNVDSNLNGDQPSDRAIVNPNGIAGTGSGVTGYDRNGRDPALGEFQRRLSRTSPTIRMHAISSPDSALMPMAGGIPCPSLQSITSMLPSAKSSASPSSDRFEIGAQFYNLLNHPAVCRPDSRTTSPLPKSLNRNFLLPEQPNIRPISAVFA